MPLTFQTEGIILKAEDLKEADRLYTVLTRDFGKLRLRAQGVKKINSKLAGHLDPIALVNLFVAQARGFSKIGGAQIKESYPAIKKDLNKLTAVNSCLMIIDDLILEEQKDEAVYNLTGHFLSWINKEKFNSLILQSYLLKILFLLGYKPDYSQSTGDLAKVLRFLSEAEWSDIQKLRLKPELWQKLKLIFDNFLKLHLSRNLQNRKIPL